MCVCVGGITVNHVLHDIHCIVCVHVHRGYGGGGEKSKRERGRGGMMTCMHHCSP